MRLLAVLSLSVRLPDIPPIFQSGQAKTPRKRDKRLHFQSLRRVRSGYLIISRGQFLNKAGASLGYKENTHERSGYRQCRANACRQVSG